MTVYPVRQVVELLVLVYAIGLATGALAVAAWRLGHRVGGG